MLTSSMYEGNGSFASGTTASNNNNNIRNQGETMDSSSSSARGSDGGTAENVDPPPFPPPGASAASFPPPPVRIVETSTADWRMMVVDQNANGHNNHVNNDIDENLVEDDDDYELVQGGVLILDGVSSTGGEENPNGDPDASLSVPDSDNIPSDPGTIHGANVFGVEADNNAARNPGNWEHLISDDEDDDDDGQETRGDGSRVRRRRGRMTLNDIYPSVCRLLRTAGETIQTAYEGNTLAEDASSAASSIGTSLPQFMRTTGFSLLVVALAVLLIPGYSYYQMAAAARNFEAQWILLQEENERLQLQEEALRKEMEILQEEAAVAMAKATSIRREHEKWKLWNSATGGNSGEKDFYFVEDEDCDKNSFTVLDNCWVKAKANVRLGDCVDETKDFFTNLWNNFWGLPESWGYEDFGTYGFEDPQDYYAIEPYLSSPCSPSDSEEDCKQKKQDEYDYYDSDDPLGTVFSAVQSFGQSLSDKMFQIMRDESTTARAAATELEDTIQKGFSRASTAITDAMESTKKDLQSLSQEVLTIWKAAVPNAAKTSSETKSKLEEEEVHEEPSKPLTVTRKGLFDAAGALDLLSNTWKEAVVSMSTGSSNDEYEKN